MKFTRPVLWGMALLLLIPFVRPDFTRANELVISGISPGSCLKGGTTQQINWNGALFDHIRLSYQVGLATPVEIQYPLNGSLYGWTLPSITGSVRLVGEGYNSSNQLVATGTSAVFQIDSSPPSAPEIIDISKTNTSTTLTWSASVNAGCMGLKGYRLYKNNQPFFSPPSITILSHTDAPLSVGSTNVYYVEAYDDFFSVAGQGKTVVMDATPAPSPSTSSPPDDPRGNEINPRTGKPFNATPKPGMDIPTGQEACYAKSLEASRLQDLVSGKATMTQADKDAVLHCAPKTVLTPQQILMDCLKQGVGEDFLVIAEGRKRPTPEQQEKSDPCFRTYYQSVKKLELPDPGQVRLVKERPEIIEVDDIKIKNDQVMVSGKGPANAQVTVYIFSDPVTLTAQTDESGNWTLAYGGLPDGSHRVYALSATEEELVRSPETGFKKEGEVIQTLEDTSLFYTEEQHNNDVARWALIGGLLALIAALTALLFYRGRVARKK
jgi:hypothetical protein